MPNGLSQHLLLSATVACQEFFVGFFHLRDKCRVIIHAGMLGGVTYLLNSGRSIRQGSGNDGCGLEPSLPFVQE